jgi:hypothetical protein
MQIRTTSALRSTRSVVPWLTIGGQPPAAQIGGYLRVGADQRISLNVTGFSADTAPDRRICAADLPDARCRQRRADQPFQGANGVALNAFPITFGDRFRPPRPANPTAGNTVREIDLTLVVR